MSSNNTTYAIITGTVVIAIVSFAIYNWWPFGSPKKSITQDGEKKAVEASKPKASPVPPKSTPAVASKPVETKSVEVTVEDAEESESEDEEEEDDDEEDGGEDQAVATKKAAEEEMLALRAKYDDINRVADKLIKGGSHARAAEKLTEAIELAKSIPAVNKDVLTLYNNRSAMYEKCSEFEKSLQDITVVLTMDPNHMKARTRRARVYEALGKNKQALMDYVYGMVVERMRQEDPSNEKKIEALSKKVAAESAVNILLSIRTNQSRALPSRRYNYLYARNLLETFPNFHAWRVTNAAVKENDLIKGIVTAVTEGNTVNRIKATLQLVCYFLTTENYSSAFENLKSVEDDFKCKVLTDAFTEDKATDIPNEVISQCWELKGTEYHLRCFLNGAKDAYLQASRWNPNNIDAKMKLACTHMELGEMEQATAIYNYLLDRMSVVITPPSVPTTSARSIETDRGDGTPVANLGESFSEDGEPISSSVPSTPVRVREVSDNLADLISPVDSDDERNAVTANSTPAPRVSLPEGVTAAAPFDVSTPTLVSYKAWTLIHRSNTYLALNDNMQYQTDAIKNAMRDLDSGLALSESVLDTPEGKAAKFIGLMKTVHVLSQTKPLIGEKTTEAESARNARSLKEAAKLFPTHESRLLMEADLLSSEGDSDQALKIIDELSKTSLKDDVTPLVMKASFLCTKALLSMQNEPQPQNEYEMNLIRARSAEMFQGVESFYGDALAMEPNSLEVLAQYAQFKNMVTGDFPGAVEMLKKAVPLARTRDEALELCQLLVMNESQWAAIQEIQKQF